MTDGVERVDVVLEGALAVGDKLHGGYLLREVVRASLTEDHPHPMAVSAQYLSSPVPGPAVVEVERTRTGRRVASTRLRLVQDGRPMVDVLLSAGRLADAEPYWAHPAGPPAMPDPEDLARASAQRRDGVHVGFLEHVDFRLDPATVGYTGTPVGPDAERAEVRGWLRRADGADVDVLDLLVLADSLPPVTFGLGLNGWVPTVELTVLVRGLPAPGWVRAVQTAQLLEDGWLDEDCSLWDSRGRLVAQARQLAGYRTG